MIRPASAALIENPTHNVAHNSVADDPVDAWTSTIIKTRKHELLYLAYQLGYLPEPPK
jgi:hypothetical protein